MSTVFVDLIQVEPLTFDEYVVRYPSRQLDSQPRYDRYLARFQPWRWVAKDADNQEKMARSTERYFNREDAVRAIVKLFGADSWAYLREAGKGNRSLRGGA